jgi:hypothetical protein
MKIKKGFLLKEIANNYIVVAVSSAAKNFDGAITLNSVSAFLWKQLENESTIESLVTALVNEYEVDKKTATNDVQDFVKKIQEAGLVE